MSIAMAYVAEEIKPGETPWEEVSPNGRLRVIGVSDSERNFAIAVHLSPFAFLVIGPLAFLAPLVIWLVRKNHSAFNDDHGREMINFLITYLILGFLLCWTFIVPAVLIIVGVINMVRGAIAAANSEYFRYPMTFRFLS